MLFEPSRTRAETAILSLKTNNLEAYLLSLVGYGTYVNVLTLYNLLNVQKSSICRTVYRHNIQKSKHEQIYGKSSKVIDLVANRKRMQLPISH